MDTQTQTFHRTVVTEPSFWGSSSFLCPKHVDIKNNYLEAWIQKALDSFNTALIIGDQAPSFSLSTKKSYRILFLMCEMWDGVVAYPILCFIFDSFSCLVVAGICPSLQTTCQKNTVWLTTIVLVCAAWVVSECIISSNTLQFLCISRSWLHIIICKIIFHSHIMRKMRGRLCSIWYYLITSKQGMLQYDGNWPDLWIVGLT